MSKFANNSVASAYQRLQSGYADASNDERLQILLVLKQLLIESPGYTVIFDHEAYDHTTGQRIGITAREQLGSVQRHIDRINQCG